MTTQNTPPVEKPDIEKQPSHEQTQSALTDKTLAAAVVQARDVSRPLPSSVHTDAAPAATPSRPTGLTMAEYALDAHLNGSENLQPISRVAEDNFARHNVGSSSFEARQYVVQANMSDNRPTVETVKLNAGGQEYQGFRYMNPQSGREYFFANDQQHAGQRFELTRGETGYDSLRPLGRNAGDEKPIPITQEPKPSTMFRGENELAGNRPADSSVQYRPQQMPAPAGERTAGAPQGERAATPPPSAERPVSINPQLLGQIKTQLEANPKMVDELQRQAGNDWRAAAILKELGYQRPGGDATAGGGAQRPEQRAEKPAAIDGPQHAPQQQQPPKAEGQPAKVEQPTKVEQTAKVEPPRVEQPAKVEQPRLEQPRQVEPAPRQGEPAPRQGEPAPRQGEPAPRQVEPAPRQGEPAAKQLEQTPRQVETAPRQAGADRVVQPPVVKQEGPAPAKVEQPARVEQPAVAQKGESPVRPAPPTVDGARQVGDPHIKSVDTVLQGKTQVDVVRPAQPAPHDAAIAANKPPQSLETLVSSRLNDQASRQAAMDALQLAQKGKVPLEGDAQQTMRLQQLVQNVGPDAFGRLRTMIQDQTTANTPLRLDGKFDPVTAARLRDFLDLTLNGAVRRPDTVAADRPNFSTLVRSSDLLTAGRAADGNTTRASAQELGNLVRQFNNNLPADGQQQPIALRDLIGRNVGDQNNAAANAAYAGIPVAGLALRDILDRMGGRNSSVPADPPPLRPENLPPQIRPEPRLQPPDAGQPAFRPENLAPQLRPEMKLDDKAETRNPNETGDRQAKADHAIAHTSEIAAASSSTANNPAQSELDDKTQLRQQDKERDEKLKEEDARRLKDEEDARLRKAEDEARKQREQAEAAAMLAILAGKKGQRDTKEAEEEAAAEKAKRDDEKRVKYIVKQGDTLESIAAKMLRDKELAGLIYDINKTIIPSKVENGRSVPELKVGLVIWLPTTKDIKDYRVKLMTGAAKGIPGGVKPAAPEDQKFASSEDELAARFGGNWGDSPAATPTAEAQTAAAPKPGQSPIPPAPISGIVPGTVPAAAADAVAAGFDEAAREAFATRRSNIESMLGPLTKQPHDEKPRYVVRLGDTLKSIAMKHPALNDVKLWRLLAEVNGLSTGVDEKGNPLVPLKRGQVLSLPMQEEVNAFLGGAPVVESNVTPPPNLVPDLDVSYTGMKAIPDAAKPRNPKKISQKMKAIDAVEEGYKIVNQRSASSRVLQCGDGKDLANGFKLRLETKQGDEWKPVVSYEIYEDVSLRHEYKPGGDRRTIRIDLPAQAAVELAQNDITSNWTNYCLKFGKSK